MKTIHDGTAGTVTSTSVAVSGIELVAKDATEGKDTEATAAKDATAATS